jgi:mannose-6-phosphate isomerase-like protein (cupin superfamily)
MNSDYAGFFGDTRRHHPYYIDMSFVHQQQPFRIPTDDGKTIEEHFGVASAGGDGVSVAHMIAPAGWSEPPQRPEFDEYTLMVRGRKQIDIDGERVILSAGESLLVQKGSTVQYANPFEEDAEYWSVCIPAFTPGRVHRQEP